MRRVRSRNSSHLKKRKILGVLFDWDGTLLNSYEADATAYTAMFRAMNIAWGPEDLAQHYSPNWYNVYRAAGLHESRWEAADLAWRAEYATQRPRLLPGARTLLTKLQRHYALGLVTSGDRDRVSRQLRNFRLMRTFPVRVCSGDTAEKKPHPAPLRMALNAMRLDPRDCVYVGDTREDILMARRAGVRTIGIPGPFPTAQKLKRARPDVLLETLEQLPQTLRRMQP
jgi:HAD superfamily hydrolase (TIGR01549 family)